MMGKHKYRERNGRTRVVGRLLWALNAPEKLFVGRAGEPRVEVSRPGREQGSCERPHLQRSE